LYLAEGEPLTLVDVGPRYDPAREELEKGLAGCGYRVADLERIILTHAHADHCGLAAELVRAAGAEVLTHAANLPWLADDADAQRSVFYGEVMHWAGVPVEVMMAMARMRRGIGRYAEPLVPDCTLADSDVLRLGGEDWQVLHTPGHMGGLVCLYQPQRRLLISSDHLLRDISSNPIVEPPAPGETERPRCLVEYMAQLRRVAALDVALALPGHGPSITDHRALIRERLAFHKARARRVLEILDDGTFTGHLEWLEVEDRVTHDERDGVARWRRVG